MEDKTNPKNKQKQFSLLILGIFVGVAILICGFVFIHNYDDAFVNRYDSLFSAREIMAIRYIFLAMLYIVSAVVLKVIFRKRVRILVLLLTATIVPIICYHFNYITFKKDGALYPLVAEGGIFHFITIGDYNFDGINDQEYHILYDERQFSTTEGGHFNDTLVDFVNTTAIGTGGALHVTNCSYDWEMKTLNLEFQKDVMFKEIKILVKFKDTENIENVSFHFKDDEFTTIKHTVENSNTLSITFDSQMCKQWQNNSEKEWVDIPIYIYVDE